MRERPLGSELLEIARSVLREKLLKNLPTELHYDALMIANAMAIAARQLEFGEKPEQEEMASLLALLNETKQADNLRAELLRLNRLLVNKVRSGEFDNGAAAKAHLWAAAVQKCKESAPKALG